MRFLILRHPETTANAEERYVGRGDAPYTAAGEAQAHLLASEIVAWMPDRLFTSPLRRTREVAVEAARLLGVAPAEDTRLIELDFGDAEGMTFDEVRAAGITFDFESVDAPVAPKGESRRDIFLRSRDFAIEQELLGRRVAIVTHGGVLRSLLVHLLDLPMDAIWSFDIRPAQIAEIRRIGGHGSLSAFWRHEMEAERGE